MKKMLLKYITVSCYLFAPLVNVAQAPVLGTAADFILFSSDGAVGNTGLSQLTGNVGTNNGAITGFGNVNGVMHNADLATAAAAADLLITYNLLNSAIPNYFPAPLLGNGDTLTAGVYQVAGVSSLSNSLYLDAAGDSNAVFIFQLQAAFSTDPNAKIHLLNGAQACNVFWKVEGAVTMGTATSMKGTIVANNAAISMSTNDTLEGRALSTAGAITINGVLAYTPTGCGSPLHLGPVAPNLGSAACYAILSGNGSVINSGVTFGTGDIGTNVGLTVGFDPLNIAGTVHPIPDVSTAQATADLLIAYNYLNTLPYDIELLYPAQFGNNLVLTPHTYLLNAATSFTDTLYLNAEGDSNGVFVIQINGALTTSTFSNVVLINGALAKNVYWKVDGAVNINDYSVFNGTIIANNGAVNLTTGDSLNGRAFTTTGAISTAAIVATSPLGNCTPLPVSWLYFRGHAAQNNVVLEWATAVELNNVSFTIEKSRDGTRFENIGTVTAGTGNAVQQYSFTDRQPYTTGYYRIGQTDRDGLRSYYHTILVKLNAVKAFAATQYVQGNQVFVKVSGATPGIGILELYGMEGKKITSQTIQFTGEASTYTITQPLAKGTYLLNIISQGKRLHSAKLMVL
jgi:hypothetical protein